MLTVTDEEALQHVNQEMEAKAAAPFTSDRLDDVPFMHIQLYFSHLASCMRHTNF